MAAFKAPSSLLLRTFLNPSPCTTCQIRFAANYMPRSKYAKVNRLDKLHRKQKKAIRAERQTTIDRAETLVIPPPPQSTTQDPLAPSNALRFSISRTHTNNIPVYETSKAGGSKHITQLRKTSGNLDALVQNLRSVLGLEESYVNSRGKKVDTVTINRLTGHVIVRGWKGAEVKKWAEGLGF